MCSPEVWLPPRYGGSRREGIHIGPVHGRARAHARTMLCGTRLAVLARRDLARTRWGRSSIPKVPQGSSPHHSCLATLVWCTHRGPQPCAYVVAVGLWMDLAAIQTAPPRHVPKNRREPVGHVHNHSSGRHRGRHEGEVASQHGMSKTSLQSKSSSLIRPPPVRRRGG